MKGKKNVVRRKPRKYIPGYDRADYAGGLLEFSRGRLLQPSPPGRPKTPTELKDFKLIQLLLNIDRLELTRIINWSQIEKRLRRDFGEEYPPTRSSKLRKDIAAAFALLHRNAERVKDERLSRLLIMYEKYLAK
jgi:hypothetical protein